MAKSVTVRSAMAHLRRLIARVEAGEEFVIMRGRTPVARFIPFRRRQPKRRFGALRGKASIGPEFFEPLPEDELKAWE